MEQIKKILIVEDDGLLLNVLSDKFKSFNFQILKAQDGKQAVDLILKERPALVLLDLMVPKMDGFQILEHIRHYPDKTIANTKIIVLSNLWSAKDILSAKALKIEEYFVKTSTDLDQVCQKALACLKTENT